MDEMDTDEDHPPSTKGGGHTSGPPATPSSTSGPLSSTSTTFPAHGSGTGTGAAVRTAAQLQHDAQLAASKRRRGAGIVTPIACSECRKKRAKCDGHRPCARCKSLGTDCVYEVPVRQSKETLRHEIETLRRQQRNNEQVFSALVRSELWEEVLVQLRNGQTVDNISEWLSGTLPRMVGGSVGGSEVSGGGPFPPGSLSHAIGLGSSSGGQIRVPPSASFAPGGQAPYVPQIGIGHGHGHGPQSADSPASSHVPVNLRQDPNSHSPWTAPFSSHTTPSESQPDFMNWTSEEREGPVLYSWVANQDNTGGGDNRKFRGLDQVLSPEIPETKVSASAWTKVTDDSRLVQHLLALYFCWEYPTFASLSKEHFLKDFQDGRTRYCSSMLVNAIIALGCRFSSQPNTRANEDDLYSSGDHFFEESLRLFHEEEDHHTLTTIQTLGIMSIREASCGRDSESWYYAGQSIRLAMEMGLHRTTGDASNDDETAVKSATFWGAFALDHAWSLATGSLPQCSCFPQLPPKPEIINDIEASLWVPYTDNGVPLQRACEQPSNVRSVYKCFCELSQVVHESLYVLYAPVRPLNGRDVLRVYTKYLDWYDRIPETLRLGHNFTPAVLFAHMYYHFAILLLFRPIIKLRIIASNISPRDLCLQAADAIQGLTRSYAQLYTLRRTPSFVPYFVLTSAIMHLAIGTRASSSESEQKHPPQPGGSSQAKQGTHGDMAQRQPPQAPIEQHAADAIRRGIADLAEMAPCHHFAEQALNILRFLARKWGIEVPSVDRVKELERGSGRGRRAGPDSAFEFKYDEAKTRPKSNSLNFFAPNATEKDVVCAGPPVVYTRTKGDDDAAHGGQGKAKEEQQEPLPTGDPEENPLFWPFPMQGRPMLPTGQELREAGFEVI